MSISSALSNAYSGLSAVSRNAEVISNNVSNALTEGYSRRVIDLSSNVLGGQGGGVRVDSISRQTDPIGTYYRRQSEASFRYSEEVSSSLDRFARLLGEPGGSTSLATQFSVFENAFSAAAVSPDSAALLGGIVAGAKTLVATFNSVSTDILKIRTDAEHRINEDVQVVNSSLKQIEKLTKNIVSSNATGKSTVAFEDQRKDAIDTINRIIPINVTENSGNGIFITTTGGVVLMNDTARELAFAGSNMVTPGMTLESGALSAVSVNGKPLNLSGLQVGTLAAHLAVRDLIGPSFQQQIDGLAKDLVNRFQSPATDPSVPIGGAGLFTDQGIQFSTGNEIGLAGRIEINAIIDPQSGGQPWKIRDGLGSVVPGDVGGTTQLLKFHDVLTASRIPNVELTIATNMSASGFAEEISGLWALESEHSKNNLAGEIVQFEIYKLSELNATGVNSDEEMQMLLLVEQAYAANAKVISVIDGLMQTLLEI